MKSQEIKKITFRLPRDEYDKLRAYCESTSRTATELFREFIRQLPEK
jgi:predicted DNA-binding protein